MFHGLINNPVVWKVKSSGSGSYVTNGTQMPYLSAFPFYFTKISRTEVCL